MTKAHGQHGFLPLARSSLRGLLAILAVATDTGGAHSICAHAADLPLKNGSVCTLDRSPSLLQLATRASVLPVPGTLATVAAWTASTFGPCFLKSCSNTSPQQFRDVECRSVFTAALLHPDACANLQRPASARQCDCQKVQCAPRLENESRCGGGETGMLPEDMPQAASFDFVGCFPQAAGDVDESRGTLPRDETCILWSSAEPCRSGLPFYRMHSDALTPLLCFDFCADNGLDLFGLVARAGGSECRCGASPLNAAVWRGAPRPGLLLPGGLAPGPPEGECPVRAYRFAGHYAAGAPAAGARDWPGVRDVAYVDSVAAGREVPPEALEDGAPGGRGAAPPSDLPAGPGWGRACWPGACGPGAPWPERRAAPPAGAAAGPWREYAVLRYAFDQGVDDLRRETLWAAMEIWQASTCVRFAEESNPEPPYFLVGVYSANSCWANLGYAQRAKLNMGWCNNMRYVGNVVHELGHILGMNHEQKRPDAGSTYFGQGPHLVLFWGNIPTDWRSQYTADPSSYTGSADDGPGDPHVGFAPYDFESIMHYPGGNRFDTSPPEAKGLTGQRSRLSRGDVEQILDTYQCKTPTPATTPTASPSTAMGFSPVGGAGRACRGADATDTSPEYYRLVAGVGSLAACESLCVAEHRCRGVEYHGSGRCELWTRDGGIGSSLARAGYACLRYGPAVAFSAAAAGGAACRGAEPGDNAGGHYRLLPGLGLEACRAACEREPRCVGVEHAAATGRCEVWTRPGGIRATAPAPGFQCLRYGPDWALDGLFAAVDGGADRACRARGAAPGPGFRVFLGAASLAACKALCVGEPLCSGVEHSRTGYCEVWTHPGGISHGEPAEGFTCLSFGPTAAAGGTFEPVDGGAGRACRGANEFDSSDGYYSLLSAPSLAACKALCAESGVSCRGVEYGPHGRCEIWTRAGGIQATLEVQGYTCLRLQ